MILILNILLITLGGCYIIIAGVMWFYVYYKVINLSDSIIVLEFGILFMAFILAIPRYTLEIIKNKNNKKKYIENLKIGDDIVYNSTYNFNGKLIKKIDKDSFIVE